MKLHSLAIGTFLAACLCASAPVATAANLLVNGDFESPAPADGKFIIVGGGSGALTGWTVTGPANNAVALLNTNYTEPRISFEAQSGQTSLDITGGGNSGPTSGISQSVNTTAGQRYTLDFWVGNADGRDNGDNYLGASSVDLRIDGAEIQPFTNGDLTLDAVNWREFSWSFTAAGPTTNIAFFNATTGDAYAGLDHVGLSAVPEPASWAMMIVGFGFAGAGLRRRRGTAAALA